MYRLFQENKNPRQEGDDDEAVNPLPAPFYGDQFGDDGIPFQVTVEPVGDEPSALDDGSAMAYQRGFEELWRALEQEAIRNGWTHIQPGQFLDANNVISNSNSNDDEDDEDEVTEWGINSIPPNIIDPGYGDLAMPTTNGTQNRIQPPANINVQNQSTPKTAPPAAAAADPPAISAASNARTTVQGARNISPSSSNVGSSNLSSSNSGQTAAPASPAIIRPSYESSNNDTPIHANYNRWATDDMNSGSEQPSGRTTRIRSRRGEEQNVIPVADNLLGSGPPPPLPAERPRRISLDDDPGPQLAQASRWVEPPRAASAAAASAAVASVASSDAETEAWQTIPSSLTEERAKFISAGIIKPNKNTNLGIELKANRDGAVEIERIANDGFLFVSGTPLKVGDLITGIKTSKASYTCGHIGGMRKNEIVRLLKRATGRLTLIAENPSGDPDRIECMTSKPHPEFGTGIFFLSGSPGSKILQIHSVPSNGLFANSLLHRGAKVLSINGVDCTELDACVATDIVKSAPRFVSIVAESSRRSSVDYAVDPAAHLRSVPESEGSAGGGERRSSFGIFRRRSGTKIEGGSDHSPRSVDC